ncbi:ribosome silencing factor [Aureimonas leprariae]|uniref:Ribosomal silencing factor RsfS n=1 Tax=Plantimonas leprariae TaxID=2615207 RepID=A0A7V7TXF7_9HYPH|nr:ribosome silencing factor [Aureimonas leprariae]KAB0681296.1 ribosome silencing factor [Aureimonas leprariae]
MGKGNTLLRTALKADQAPTSPAASETTAAGTGPTLIDTVLRSLDDSKAEDVFSIDLTGKSPLADHMVVVSGRSNRHVTAVADHLLRDLKDAGYGTARVEGLQGGDWVLIDIGDVIVHVFRPEVRAFYNLEKMWSVGEAESTVH